MPWEKESVRVLLFGTNHGKENGTQSLRKEILKVLGTKKR
jgi:hypothetical protein